MADDKNPPKPLTKMPSKLLQDRAEAFMKGTNRKGRPMIYGTGKPPGKERESAKN